MPILEAWIQCDVIQCNLGSNDDPDWRPWPEQDISPLGATWPLRLAPIIHTPTNYIPRPQGEKIQKGDLILHYLTKSKDIHEWIPAKDSIGQVIKDNLLVVHKIAPSVNVEGRPELPDGFRWLDVDEIVQKEDQEAGWDRAGKVQCSKVYVSIGYRVQANRNDWYIRELWPKKSIQAFLSVMIG
jgi:hypothetical protein